VLLRRVGSGEPEPLGLTLVPGGANVAVFSAHATSIELCLFDGTGQAEIERIALPEKSGDVFHGFVAGVGAGTRYGLRAHGPYDPRHGQRFNAAKLLVDPYATALDRRFALHPALFGELPDGVTRNDADSGPFVPKGIARLPFVPVVTTRPRVPWADTIIYELHVRGYTQLQAAVPEALRGTCAGLAHPAAIEHLTRLGITTVELMPIAAAIDERHLPPLGLTNAWLYNPAALFVPDPRLAPGGIDEFAACIASLHTAGIEVVQDIVLNHTGESDALGPTVSLRGLDNATYYRTIAGDPGAYINDTGCGNTLALDRPPVLRLAMDALRWYAAAGVDGFRFDLATTLGRRNDGFDPAAPLLQAIGQDPLLRNLKLIAEPWDLGPGGYRLGAFPPGWGEWNDAYRDTVRRFWRGDAGSVGALATRVAGSGDIFTPRARPPSRSVNFVTAHDGFTLADLVSYTTKHNAANGENNRDGTDTNYSWNHGVEGATDDPAIRSARRRDVQSLLATLLLSRGTPLLAMGDELGRSQQGNNNTYAQNNPLAWVDWDQADQELAACTGSLIALRKRHPALRADRALTGSAVDASGIPDVEWRRPDGNVVDGADWTRSDNRVLIAILYAPATSGQASDRVALAINAGYDAVAVHWPAPRAGYAWRTVADTSVPGGRPVREALTGESSELGARSVTALAEEASAIRRTGKAGIEPQILAQLAAAAGIAPVWDDVTGRRHVVAAETTCALLAAMGLGADTTGEARDRLAEMAATRDGRRLPPVCVVHEGCAGAVAVATGIVARASAAPLRLTCEDGTEIVLPLPAGDGPAIAAAANGSRQAQRMLALPPLPTGYHTLRVDGDPDRPCRIIVAPSRCYLPPELRAGGRRFGVAAHLYALRRRGDQGIGDFTTLRELAAGTARAGGVIVGINPLHALFNGERERASPYHPSDRRFLDPIYIDVERAPDLAPASAARRLLAADAPVIAQLAARATVDYTGVWDVKRAVLDACFAAFESRRESGPLSAEFDRFITAGGEPLRQFALFEAIAAVHPRVAWTRWPAGLRSPDAPDIAGFARQHARNIRFALYLQWVADRQFAAVAKDAHADGLALGIYRDLAVGAAPDGAEAWANPAACLARGASIGAPPDPLATGGQIWHLPPPIPAALTATGYAGFRELVAANMRHAGALRVDHAMGVTRLFWIPDGAKAMDGAYVHYPQEDLLAVLALESHRARCLVVGEDLGTVPAGFRERLAAADILSYRVLWFEREGSVFKPPSHYAVNAAACISTHDLPTVAGWWNGADVDEKHALGLIADAEVPVVRALRSADKAALATALDDAGVAPAPIDPAAPHAPGVTAAVHRYACASPSSLVLMQADDLAGETVMLNLPGTDRERPNWRRKIAIETNALWETPVGRDAAADFGARKP
jgi:glycogen debranching enzyme GlgX/4-alpha-glucanotransferase